MKKIYVDNSSTTFPKAPGVSDKMKDFMDNVGCNVNRGGYEDSYNTAMEIFDTRNLLCDMFHFNEPRNVIFTPGITYSLNMILRGLLKEGDHVITTSMEHNAVMRPLYELSKIGILYDIVPCGIDGTLDVSGIESLINTKTKAVVMTHASNVCGTVLPIYDAAKICRRYGVSLVVDSAQTAGVLDIDMLGIDALAFTCHKGLLASPGLGGFLIQPELSDKINPLITGGTGSLSHEITQPDFMPDKFEAGTMNIPAILGLKKSLEYIKDVGIKKIYDKEISLTESFIERVSELEHVSIVGKRDVLDRTAVISLDFKHMDNALVAAALDRDYGIMTRCGLHCAPNAHKTLGTYPKGTVRFSFGHFNTTDEIDCIICSIKKLYRKHFR